jgi:hypothetical protein
LLVFPAPKLDGYGFPNDVALLIPMLLFDDEMVLLNSRDFATILSHVHANRDKVSFAIWGSDNSPTPPLPPRNTH